MISFLQNSPRNLRPELSGLLLTARDCESDVPLRRQLAGINWLGVFLQRRKI